MRKICFVTGTRAEYGLLSRLMRMVKDCSDTQLQIIATNMHLMSEYGNTYQEIENDGFKIDRKVYMNKPSDDTLGIVSSMSVEMEGMSKAYSELKPDVIVLLGDRYEILVAAQVALIHQIPIAHIHGGEVTEGAFDDAIRHAITKMSSLHFTSTECYRKRVIQMGEQPDRVFNVGSLGVENCKYIELVSKEELEKSISFKLDKDTILATYHPVTLGGNAEHDIDAFCDALASFEGLRVIFTMPNSDTGSNAIIDRINKHVASHPETSTSFISLGMKRYLSVLQFVAAVVGNSSSGIIEAPTFGIPTLNVGDRQKGRVAGDSVVNCSVDKVSIMNGLTTVLSTQMQEKARSTHNLYEKPGTADAIFKVISSYPLEGSIQKPFYDLSS